MADAAKALLGALMAYPDRIYTVGEIIDPDYFYSDGHKAVYRAIESLVSQGISVDHLAVKNEAKKFGVEVPVSKLVQLTDDMPSGENADYYARLVREEYTRRLLRSSLKDAIGEINDPAKDLNEVVGTIQQSLSQAKLSDPRRPASVYPEIAEVWENYLDANKQETLDWVTTGLIDVDKQACLAQGTHTIVGASPGEGKTSLGAQILRHNAKQGKRVLLFTLEQTRKRMLQKIISQEAGVVHRRFITGTLTDEEKQAISKTANEWANANMCVLDGRWGASEIRLRAIREQQENGLDCVIVDTLGLLKKPEELTGEIKERSVYDTNSKLLQDLAIELNVPVVTLAHLNRARFSRPGARPILSDIREAGEQYCDIAMFIYHEFFVTGESAMEGIAELIVAKNRDGPAGSIVVGWDGPTTTFYSIDTRYEGPQEKQWREVESEDEKQRVLAGGIQND